MMYDLFNRLRTPRKRVLAERQLGILKLLLERESMALEEILDRIAPSYRTLRNPRKAAVRDLQDLLRLRALSSRKLEGGTLQIDIRLEWPTEITETEFFRHLKMLPTAKSPTFLG